MMLFFAFAGLILSAIPTIMFCRNLPLFCVAFSAQLNQCDALPSVSVLIPARDEEAAIGDSVRAVLASENVDVEVIVLDDNSTDSTADSVRRVAQTDSRVRCISGEALPEGWNGKQFACLQLSRAATHERLVFLDADVRLHQHALSCLIDRQDQTNVALLSAFPHQQTGTWLEKWLIPMMHLILLGFLPMARMRSTTDPSLSAGCGQLFITRLNDYLCAGTHQAIKASRHDGIKLPRAFRKAGLTTDVVDGTELAECRMYVGAAEVTRGVIKNASEGIARPKVIGVFTILLLGASVLPIATLIASLLRGQSIPLVLSVIAVILAHLPRAIAAIRFRQPWFGAACHSLATPLFVFLQWLALFNSLTGRVIPWRGRCQ